MTSSVRRLRMDNPRRQTAILYFHDIIDKQRKGSHMFHTMTIEAVTEEGNLIRPVEGVKLPAGRRALVTILDEEPHVDNEACALLSEKTLAADWGRPEEDAAWSALR
jgi:hypothetical protein